MGISEAEGDYICFVDDDDYVVKYARDHYIFTKGSEKAVVLPDENE